MTAKEMFEKLGYRTLGTLKPDDDYIVIVYEKEIYGEKEYIYFYGAKGVRIYLEDKRGRIYPPIVELEELQAINKQIEEYQKALDKTMSEKIDLENIIKEVRERVLNEGKPLPSPRELLEILDKVGSDKE